MTPRLTKAEKMMVGLLETGPLSHTEMRYGFGSRQWKRVFRNLERKGLARFDASDEAIRTAKHYAIRES